MKLEEIIEKFFEDKRVLKGFAFEKRAKGYRIYSKALDRIPLEGIKGIKFCDENKVKARIVQIFGRYMKKDLVLWYKDFPLCLKGNVPKYLRNIVEEEWNGKKSKAHYKV